MHIGSGHGKAIGLLFQTKSGLGLLYEIEGACNAFASVEE